MADYISTQRAKFAEILDGRDWEVFDKQPTAYVSLTKDAELWRSLPELSPDFISEFTDLLNVITDIKNTVECHCVDDPMAGGEIFEGRWRQAFIRRIAQGDVTKLVQVLRKGYSSEIAWDEARLVEGKDLQESEGYRTVRWVNLDPSKTQTMALSLSATSFTDKVINGETLSGEWHNIFVSPSVADDGSGVITMQLAQPEFTLTAYQNALTPKARDVTYYFQVPKDLAQAIIDEAKVAGSSATANYGNASGLVDIVVSTRSVTKTEKLDVITAWNCRYKEYTDYHFGVTEAEADAIELTEPPAGWSYELKKTDNGDGTWDVWVVKRQVQYRDAAFQNSQISGDSTVTTRQQLGLTTQTAEPVTSTAGVVMSQRVEIKDDCSKDIHTNKDTGIAQTSTLTVASPSRTSTTVEKSVQSSLVATATSAKGHIKRSVNKDSKYPSRYDTTEADEIPTNQTETSADDSAAKSAARVLNTENPFPLGTPSASAGIIKRNENTPTDAGNTRTVEEVITVKDQSASSADHSAAADSSKTIHTENASVPALSASAGVVVRVEGIPTEAGKYRTTEETITVKDQTAVSTDISKAAAATKTVHTEGAALSADSATKGTIYRQESTPTEAGKYQTLRNVTVPTDQTAVSVDNSLAQAATRTLHTENVVDLTAPSIVKGTITRQQATSTEAGNQRTVEEVIIPTDQTAVSVDNSLAGVNTRTLHTENIVDLVSPVIVAGTITRQQATSTEAGNQRTVEEVIVPTNQTEEGESHSAAADSTEQIDTELAKTDYDALDKDAADFTIRDIRATPTEAGNVRVQDRVVTPANQTETGEAHSSAADSTEEVNTEMAKTDYDALDKDAADFTIRDIRATPTEAGNVRVQDSVVTPIDQESLSGETAAARTVTATHHTENLTEPTITAQEDGHIHRLESRQTEAGNFATNETDVAVIDQTGVGGEDSLARGVVNTVHTENTTEPVATASPGTVKRVSSTPTEAGRFRTEETVITPKSRTLTEGAADAFKTSLNTIKTQEVTQEAVPIATAGKVISVRNQPTETGFQTEKNEVTAVAKDSGSFISAYTDDAIITTQKYHNAAAIVAATDVTGHDITVEGDINDFEKYDYVKKDVQARIPVSATGATWIEYSVWIWENVTSSYAGEVAERSYVSAIWQYRRVNTNTLTFHLTAAAASAAVTGGNEGSGISRAGNNLWQAHKVVVTYETVGLVNFAAPKTVADADGSTRSVPKKA